MRNTYQRRKLRTGPSKRAYFTGGRAHASRSNTQAKRQYPEVVQECAVDWALILQRSIPELRAIKEGVVEVIPYPKQAEDGDTDSLDLMAVSSVASRDVVSVTSCDLINISSLISSEVDVCDVTDVSADDLECRSNEGCASLISGEMEHEDVMMRIATTNIRRSCTVKESSAEAIMQEAVMSAQGGPSSCQFPPQSLSTPAARACSLPSLCSRFSTDVPDETMGQLTSTPCPPPIHHSSLAPDFHLETCLDCGRNKYRKFTCHFLSANSRDSGFCSSNDALPRQTGAFSALLQFSCSQCACAATPEQ